ncbi:MAG: hypothetical protein R2862_10000 [Thermoanaerobaculia bacterium]
MSKRIAAGWVGVLLLPVLSVAPAAADGWKSEVAAYLVAAGLSGRASAGPIVADVDMSFSDILDNLQFGGMAAFSTTDGRWVWMADAVVANVGTTERGEGGALRADLDSDTTILEGDFGVQLTRGFTVFGGARYVDLASKIAVGSGNQTLRASSSESWVDPVVGFRWSTTGNDRWAFWIRGDVGGFGVGSEKSWNAVAALSFRLTERVRLGAGYRALDIEYEHGSGADRFVYDTRMEGPVAGSSFSFWSRSSTTARRRRVRWRSRCCRPASRWIRSASSLEHEDRRSGP